MADANSTRNTYQQRSRHGKNGTVHVDVAEAALGKKLPKGAVVHHVNGLKFDNRNANLVICQNAAYHNLLHARTRVVRRGGNPNTEKVCPRCQKLTLKADLASSKSYCHPCAADRARARYRAMKVLTDIECACGCGARLYKNILNPLARYKQGHNASESWRRRKSS